MQEEIVEYLKNLRDEIVLSFEAFEPKCRFERKPWKHHSGGGGEISVLRGDVFEKAAVNWSGVRGNKVPFGDDEGPFLIRPFDRKSLLEFPAEKQLNHS